MNGWDQDGEQNNRDKRCDAGKREVLSKGRGDRGSWNWGAANQPGRQGGGSETSDQHARPVPGSGQLAAVGCRGPSKHREAGGANFVIGH